MTARRQRPLAGAVAGAVVLVAVAAGMLRGEPVRQSFNDAVAEITAFVERERGLTFIRPPTIVVAGQRGLAQRVREAEAKTERLGKESDLHLTLGILPPDVDMVERLNALQSVSVQAKFDAETREVVLKNTALTPYARATLAHELTHALDDQHFGLHLPELARARDGSDFGLRALGEGNARRVEFAYLATLTDADRREDYAERTGLEAYAAGAAVHPYLGLYIGAPYEYGPALVAAILDHGGQQALDDAFRSPPKTHEQVLFPKRYLDREPARTVKAPDADGQVTDSGVIGAFKLGVMLAGGPGQGPAAGWGGDRYVVWHDDGGRRACLRARMVGDAPEDTTALAIALRQWARQQPDASMQMIDGQIEFTACNIRDAQPAWTGPDANGTVERCPGAPLAGFGKAQVTVTRPDGGTVTRCVHLADSPRRVRRGLMEVTDDRLGGYDGMLFMFPSDTASAFWMRNTPMPLSIAYLDSLGSIVSTADMQPCVDRPDCPRYPPARPYRYAVEVPQGRLADFGFVPGATLRIDGVES
ncbi:MAG TPA: DUF192 domain-containing protein [Pilimelia sp.]|nr:DUF192 domain-containing protein [Pilimelia sp.]